MFYESTPTPEVLQLSTQGLFNGGWLILFFVLAIVACVVGAKGISGISLSFAKWFIIIFVILAVAMAVI